MSATKMEEGENFSYGVKSAFAQVNNFLFNISKIIFQYYNIKISKIGWLNFKR